MLPKSLNGDKTLVHDVDEINLVIRGNGKFKMGNDVINVTEGALFM